MNTIGDPHFHRFLKTYIMLYYLNDSSEYTSLDLEVADLVSELCWKYFLRASTGSSSRSPSSTISVFLHHLAPPPIICFHVFLTDTKYFFFARPITALFIRPIFLSSQLNLDGCCKIADIDVWKGNAGEVVIGDNKLLAVAKTCPAYNC